MESTRKIVKDSVFFFFGQRRWSTPEVNAGAGGQRRKSTPVVNGLTWHWRVGTRGDAWGTRGTWGARGARGDALPDLWRRVAARGRVSEEPETSGGAWGRVRGQIRPILVSMDRS